MTEITVNGQVLDLDDVWAQIDSRSFVDELHERLGAADTRVIEAMATYAEDHCDCDELEVDPLFEPLSEWDRDNLLAAVRNDDGRRALELLRRLSR